MARIIRSRLTRSLWACFVVVAIASIGAACYNTAYHQSKSIYPTPRGKSQVAIVEADDRGNFWNSFQADSAATMVRTSVAAGPTALVLFIHGWGHNAKPGDQNLVCFANTLDYLSDVINEKGVGPMVRAHFAASDRAQSATINNDRSVHVIGIYVGWRGKSIPEPPAIGMFTSRWETFWGRKSSAARVGRGDVQAFIASLADLYDSVHQQSYNPASSFFSFVSIGHSFGAQVLLPAASARLQAQLTNQLGAKAWDALRNEGSSQQVETPIKGLGDLVILVNPATEAGGFESMNRLSRHLQFPKSQTPVMAVFSADNDFPNKAIFPIGQFLGTMFDPTSEEGQRGRDLTALGRYSPQQTHWLDWAPNDSVVRMRTENRESILVAGSKSPLDGQTNECNYKSPSGTPVNDQLADSVKTEPLTADPTGDWMINGKHLMPVSTDRQHNAALIVVRSRSTTIIDNHNGFFTPEFVDFLTRYVSSIQAKRFAHAESAYLLGTQR